MIIAKHPQYKPGRYYQSMLEVSVGDKDAWCQLFTTADVQRMIIATGDASRIHFDKEYAKKTIFRSPIVHGVAIQGAISAHLALCFPGEGTFVREINCIFSRPVYHGDLVEFCVIVSEVDLRREVIVLNLIAHARDKVVVRGKVTLRILEEVE